MCFLTTHQKLFWEDGVGAGGVWDLIGGVVLIILFSSRQRNNTKISLILILVRDVTHSLKDIPVLNCGLLGHKK